jgi:Peptidase family M28
MKRAYTFLSFLFLIGLIYYSFYSLMPRTGTPSSLAETEFSTERALVPLKEITKAPHFIGSKENARVREYLMGELRKLGLEPQTQEGYIINEAWESMDKPVNIVAKIEGSENGKALLIFSHYDSALVPSFGASDAGSGVVTILETLRAFKSSGKKPKNDIIVLFTDGEEVGLDGAKLFVRKHPWAKDVALALNFEARGSGGPSNMIVETNQGNENLVRGFIAAHPEFPVASSLMYSVYKMLPNDTDSTVLREEGDIDGLFFAFIDDHFDYHTANDTFDRLDRNTLQHQGSYLLPLLHYFADADLTQIKSDEDYVYLNFPFIKMISYPFSWVTPMVILASILFILLLLYGFKRGSLRATDVKRGFVPFLFALIIAGMFGYFGWQIILKIYPQYKEIQHGFTYNGHTYIAFFVSLTLALLFIIYRKFSRKIHPANLLVAPLCFWLLINIAVAVYLKGAAFFIIPTYFGLLALWVLIRQEQPNLLLMGLLSAPAVFIFTPLIQFFPVGLGLKMVVISCLFTVLLFGLLQSILGFYRLKKLLALGSLILALFFLIKAHLTSDFSEERQKPNSLVYYLDADTQKAYWLTYDKVLDEWTKSYIGDQPLNPSAYVESASPNKYHTQYAYAAEAPIVEIPTFQALRNYDTIVGQERKVSFTIVPKRDVNVIRLYTNRKTVFSSFSLNGIPIALDAIGGAFGGRSDDGLINYYVSPNDTLQVSYSALTTTKVSFNVLEYSFDLMKDAALNIQ